MLARSRNDRPAQASPPTIDPRRTASARRRDRQRQRLPPAQHRACRLKPPWLLLRLLQRPE
eukprot:scaffold2639_cov385-Prasinococcus_capsulatus_cf.AAC.7